MSLIVLGDQITELYSTSGLTYTKKARRSRLTSRDSKARNITIERILYVALTRMDNIRYLETIQIHCLAMA